MKYDKIINRIIEIITISKNAITVKSEEDFTKIHGFYILNEFESEFSNFLDLERTYYLFTNLDKPLEKNEELINLLNNNENFKELIDILTIKENETPDNLIEYCGYFVQKTHITSLKKLLNELSKNNKEFLKIINNSISNNLKENAFQHKRINEFLISNEIVVSLDEKEDEVSNIDFPEVNELDKLYNYFKQFKNIKIDDLIPLTQTIGIENFKNLVDSLFLNYSIDSEEYVKYIYFLMSNNYTDTEPSVRIAK